MGLKAAGGTQRRLSGVSLNFCFPPIADEGARWQGRAMTGRSASRLLTLRTVKRRVRALADRLGAEPACLPTFGRSRRDGRPHIEVGDTYCFVVRERGQLFERHCSTDLDQLLYWAFAEVTLSMAIQHELRHGWRACG